MMPMNASTIQPQLYRPPTTPYSPVVMSFVRPQFTQPILGMLPIRPAPI